jgi:hypothetical protein
MFTPAQTLITGTLVEEINMNPQLAHTSHTSHTEAATCEQTTVEYFTATTTVYQTCSSPEASYEVSWTDDLGADSMNMCTFHATEFAKDAETDDHITGYRVTEL